MVLFDGVNEKLISYHRAQSRGGGVANLRSKMFARAHIITLWHPLSSEVIIQHNMVLRMPNQWP